MQLIYPNRRRLAGLGRDLDRLLQAEGHSRQGFRPAVDIYDEPTRYVVLADLPGVDAAAIDITVEANLLTIRGERKLEPAAENAAVQRAERFSGAFERVFRLPDSAAGDGVEASYRHGVLTVSIPKPKTATPYRIEVTAH
jgi:HSP20 family protein